LLRRASVIAAEIVPVGKETDRRWEQGEDMSLLDFKVLEYRSSGNLVVADATLRDEMAKHGVREAMRRTGLSQHTLEKILRGEPVRRATLKRALTGCEPGLLLRPS
jgi:hypothetical protein